MWFRVRQPRGCSAAGPVASGRVRITVTDGNAPTREHVSTQTKIALCYGTRPQTIKASVLRTALGQVAPVVSIDSGQHYDFALSGLLYEELGVPPADYYLEVGSGLHGAQTAKVLERSEALLRTVGPGAVVVIGDTNSTLGMALAAAKLRLPVVHVEAGLRAVDRQMAEELNRRLVDALSDVLCTPSERASTALRHEGVGGHIVLTGDVARDVLLRAVRQLPAPAQAPRFALVTLHRAELVDDERQLRRVVSVIERLPLEVRWPVHPRTRAAMERAGIPGASGRRLKLGEPVGYLDAIRLIRDASVVITDSGGVQREAYWLGTPCITLRGETEWAETVASGANKLLSPEAVEELPVLVQQVIDDQRPDWPRDAYGEGDAAIRVAATVRDIVLAAPSSPT